MFGLVRKIYKRRYNDYRANALFHNIKLPEYPDSVDTGSVSDMPDLTEEQAKAFDKALAEVKKRKAGEKKKS